MPRKSSLLTSRLGFPRTLGETGAAEAIKELETAAVRLSNVGVFTNIKDIAISVYARQGPSVIFAPGTGFSSPIADDLRRQCALGNRAACD